MENVHISGELSSETLHTGYIKWPKVPLKANASEGYVVSASSNLNTSEEWRAWHAFENKSEYTSSITPAYASASDVFSGGAPINGTAASFDGYDCEWLQIQMLEALNFHIY
jgi:hypothetical protein